MLDFTKQVLKYGEVELSQARHLMMEILINTGREKELDEILPPVTDEERQIIADWKKNNQPDEYAQQGDTTSPSTHSPASLESTAESVSPKSGGGRIAERDKQDLISSMDNQLPEQLKWFEPGKQLTFLDFSEEDGINTGSTTTFHETKSPASLNLSEMCIIPRPAGGETYLEMLERVDANEGLYLLEALNRMIAEREKERE